MARGVRDAALMLNAIARADARDPLCLPDDPREWRAGIEEGVRGMRIALVRRWGYEPPLDADGEAALSRAADTLRAEGALVEEADPDLPDTRQIFGRVWGVALAKLVAATPRPSGATRQRAGGGGRAGGRDLGHRLPRRRRAAGGGGARRWASSTSATT